MTGCSSAETICGCRVTQRMETNCQACAAFGMLVQTH
jgi:hypothetical protein